MDASVAAKWVLAEADSDKALALLSEARLARARIVGPAHLPVEVTSAVYKRLRSGIMSAAEAREQLERFAELQIDLVSLEELPGRAVDLALELGWPLPYDAFSLALAIALGCEVWTADRLFYRDAHARYPHARFLPHYQLSR